MLAKTTRILNVLHLLSWIIFGGLCVFTGSVLFNIIYTLFINSADAKTFQRGIDLSSLYLVSKWIFAPVALSMALTAGLKAYMFYLIIKALQALNLVQPFSTEVGTYILRVAYIALSIGVLSVAGITFTDWLMDQHVALPHMHNYLGGGDVFLLMGLIVFVFAQIFKKGIELQSENALTV